MGLSIIQRMGSVNNQILSIREDLKVFLVDKDYQLDERWRIFKKASELGLLETNSYSLDFKILEDKKINIGEDVYIDRYQTYDLANLIGTWRIAEKLTKEEIDILKEEILACGYGSFVYDW